MGKTRPFTEAHAIATVDVGLLFSKKLSTKAREDITSALKSHLKSKKLRFVPSRSAEKTIVFRRKEAGDTAEDVHVHSGFAHVIFFEYLGWALTRDAMVDRLFPILKLARDGELVLKSAGLVFRDIFFTDNADEFSASDVFAPSGRWLPSFAISGRSQWRNTAAWTDRMESGLELKSTLTVKTSVESEDEPQRRLHVTEVTHQQEIVGNESAEPAVEWSDARFRQRLDVAHNLNKSVLLDLLSVEMAQRIGLKETS